jgi:hypothetical protein
MVKKDNGFVTDELVVDWLDEEFDLSVELENEPLEFVLRRLEHPTTEEEVAAIRTLLFHRIITAKNGSSDDQDYYNEVNRLQESLAQTGATGNPRILLPDLIREELPRFGLKELKITQSQIEDELCTRSDISDPKLFQARISDLKLLRKEVEDLINFQIASTSNS